jgi:hypothetical protein
LISHAPLDVCCREMLDESVLDHVVAGLLDCWIFIASADS